MRSWPFLLLARRRAALIVALLLGAQLALFAHAIGHDYAPDADSPHMVCALCVAAHHLDNGVAPTAFVLPTAVLHAPPRAVQREAAASSVSRAFQARAPPVPPRA